MSAREKVRQRMQLLGIEPKKSLGQNFLVNDHVIQKIIKAAKDLKPETLLEIGPGLGALTDDLAALCANYTLLELDHKFADFWRSQNTKVIEVDALQTDWKKLRARESRRV
jgi:16S rRNA (adenine1518-N6/adenine1519-N6)-dimethyltransferase